MSPTHTEVHHLAQRARALGPALLTGLEHPHDELLALVWSGRFDREHGLGLLVRQPDAGGLSTPALLPALLAAADQFDGLAAGTQRRVRQLILRHRALRGGAPAG